MARFLVCLSALAFASAAPSGIYGPGYAGVGYTGAGYAGAGYAAAGYAGAGYGAGYHQHAHTYAGQPIVEEVVVPGPAVTHHVPRTGVVGHRTVQVGSQTVLAGHEYAVAGQEFVQPESVQYPAGPARNAQHTRPLPPPAIPAPTQTFSAPAVVGHVEVYRDDNAAGRPHTIVTPRKTVVQPHVTVNNIPVDVPVHVPVPVERKVVIDKAVVQQVPVDVPHPVAVPQPYVVHPVKEVVQTPVVHEHSHSYDHAHYDNAAYAHQY